MHEVVGQILGSDNPQAAFAAFMNQMTGFGPASAGRAPANPPIDLPAAPAEPRLITVRVDLDEAEPPIWRRVAIRGDVTLDRVHTVLQAAMGWTDSHLHRFSGPGVGPWERPHFVTAYDKEIDGEGGTDEAEARLDQVLRAAGDWVTYIYDFGDDWVHTLVTEDIGAAGPDEPPARCLDGGGACPPDDVGGIHVWNEVAAALRADPDPRALPGDLREYADWLPPGIDPDAFDVDEANGLIALGPAVGSPLGSDLPGAHPGLLRVLSVAPPPVARHLAGLAHAAQEIGGEPTPEQLREALRPWRSIVETADADGIPLTQAGWIAPAACERIWHESGLAWAYGKGNREQHTPEITMQREICTHAKLIRRYKGRLILTPLGRKAVADIEQLADVAARTLIEGDSDIAADARVVTLLYLATGWRPQPAAAGAAPTPGETEQLRLGSEVARVLNELGWRHADGAPLRYGTYDSAAVVSLLTAGLPDPGRSRDLELVPGGAHLARRALFPGPG